MAYRIIPPKQSQVDSKRLEQWHRVHKTDWGTLIGIGYVDGAQAKPFSSQVNALAAVTGEVSLMGGTALHGLQPKPTEGGNLIEFPRVGGLHHRYEWKKAA